MFNAHQTFKGRKKAGRLHHTPPIPCSLYHTRGLVTSYIPLTGGIELAQKSEIEGGVKELVEFYQAMCKLTLDRIKMV